MTPLVHALPRRATVQREAREARGMTPFIRLSPVRSPYPSHAPKPAEATHVNRCQHVKGTTNTSENRRQHVRKDFNHTTLLSHRARSSIVPRDRRPRRVSHARVASRVGVCPAHTSGAILTSICHRPPPLLRRRIPWPTSLLVRTWCACPPHLRLSFGDLWHLPPGRLSLCHGAHRRHRSRASLSVSLPDRRPSASCTSSRPPPPS